MRSDRQTIAIICLFSIVSFSYSSAFATQLTTLKQRTSIAGSLPRNAKDDNDKWIGFEIEISSMLSKACDLTLESSENPINWARSLDMMKHGGLDLLTLVSYRKQRTSFMDYIGPYDIEELIMIVHKDNKNTHFNNLDDFMKDGRVYELVIGAAIAPNFDERIAKDSNFASYFTYVSRRDKFDAIAQRVERGRIFGSLTDWYTFSDMKKTQMTKENFNYNPDNLAGISINLLGKPTTYLAASKLLPLSTRNCLRDAYQETRKNGSFNEAWIKWYGDRQIPPTS